MSDGHRTLNGWPVMTSMASPPPDADGEHAQAAGVRSVTVGPDHETTREGVVLEHDLMDDPRARFPEPDAVAGADGTEKGVDLGVFAQGRLQVEVGAHFRLDEVVTVHGGRQENVIQPGGHELKGDDLRQGVLQGHPVGVEVGVTLPSFERLPVGVADVVHQDLLGTRERPAEPLAAPGHPFGQAAVDPLDHRDRSRR